MGDDQHFLTGIVNGLRHRLVEVQVLNGFDFKMVFRQVGSVTLGVVLSRRPFMPRSCVSRWQVALNSVSWAVPRGNFVVKRDDP